MDTTVESSELSATTSHAKPRLESASHEEDPRTLTEIRNILDSGERLSPQKIFAELRAANRLVMEQAHDPIEAAVDLSDNYNAALAAALETGDEKLIRVMNSGLARHENNYYLNLQAGNQAKQQSGQEEIASGSTEEEREEIAPGSTGTGQFL
jgi:uncharacterized iron-regulated protein